VSEVESIVSPSQVVAIIPYYKRADQLKRCLAAIEESTVDVEAWVHDNNTVNLGFTRACNLGLRHALVRGKRFALLLNQDCYVRPEAVGKMVEFMNAHPRCAIAGAKQVQAGDEDWIIHGGGESAFPKGVHRSGRKSLGQLGESEQVPWVNGACLMARMEAVVEMGLMDENMVLFGSDSDWCYRARMRNYEVWYCAQAEVVHEHGVSQAGRRDFETELTFENDWLYWRDKWVTGALARRLRRTEEGEFDLNKALEELRGAWAKRDGEAAEEMAREILRRRPDCAEAGHLLAACMLQLTLPAKVIRLYEGMEKSGVALTGVMRSCYGAALFQMEMYPEAEKQLRAAVEMGAKSAELFRALEETLKKLGRT